MYSVAYATRMSFPFVMSTFIALLLVLTFIDGITAADGTSLRQTRWITKALKTTPSILETTRSAVPSRDPDGRRVTPRLSSKFPTLTIPSWSQRVSAVQSSPIPERPPLSTALPAVLTSAAVPGPLSSGLPDLKSPSPRPVGPTSPTRFIRWLTSAPVMMAGGEVVHCQIQLANNYQETLNGTGSSRYIYGRELGPGVAQLCRVDEARVSDVSVFENPDTGLMVLRFNINPPLASCRQGCFLSTSQVAETARDVVDSFSFNLTDTNWRTLYVDRLPAFFSWTDDGPCPVTPCSSDGDACRASLSGQLYCECVRDCRTSRTTVDSDDRDLWALMVIPCVVIIVLIIILVIVYRRRYGPTKKIAVKTVRGYQPAYSIETLKQQPMLATLDPAALDQLNRQLECQLGNAYNCRSFDNSSGSMETLVSPLSTIRASTVGASSVMTTASDDVTDN